MAIHVGTNDAHMASQFFPSATGYHVDDAGRLHIKKDGDGNLATFHANAWQFAERVEDTKKEEPDRHLIINGASGGIPVPATDAELAKHLATTPHSTA